MAAPGSAEGGASISRVEELFSLESKIVDGTERIPDRNSFDVSVKGVSFSYEKDIEVLKDISFELPKGKVLGVLGRTGSGKTTLAKMFFVLYDYDKGEISIDNRPIKSIRLEELRKILPM